MNEYNMYDNPVNEGGREVAQVPGSGLATAAFVFGIIALVSFGCVSFSGLIALICGFVGKGKYPTHTTEYKRCRQGIVMSLISYGMGMLLAVVTTVGCIVGLMIYVYS